EECLSPSRELGVHQHDAVVRDEDADIAAAERGVVARRRAGQHVVVVGNFLHVDDLLCLRLLRRDCDRQGTRDEQRAEHEHSFHDWTSNGPPEGGPYDGEHHTFSSPRKTVTAWPASRTRSPASVTRSTPPRGEAWNAVKHCFPNRGAQ